MKLVTYEDGSLRYTNADIKDKVIKIPNPDYYSEKAAINKSILELKAQLADIDEQLKSVQPLMKQRTKIVVDISSLEYDINYVPDKVLKKLTYTEENVSSIALIRQLGYTVITSPDCVELQHTTAYKTDDTYKFCKNGETIFSMTYYNWNAPLKMSKLNDTTYGISLRISHSQGVCDSLEQIPSNARLFTFIGTIEYKANYGDWYYKPIYLDNNRLRIGIARDIIEDYSKLTNGIITLSKLHDTQSTKNDIHKHIVSKILRQG